MDYSKIKTLGDLKKSGYQSRNIKTEIRQNLISKLQAGEKVFEGIHGYENTVIPDVERALLAGHNINFLGLRGQAKTRLARQMTALLDEYIPVLEGSDLNDDPMAPLSRWAKSRIAEMGDDSPIKWLHREDRYFEKLATPDVSIADLIGDVDPIKAANLKVSYSDELSIHFGMIPRAHRCIFVINELPDLQARIQVALFNILQEGDIQIRGFKLRLPLDVQFVFTANPEDYTNRGSIVTPLKDRIGSQILTHYPKDRKTAREITRQEAKLQLEQSERVAIPDPALELLEQIAFEARENEYIDAKSGVSTRLTISALENLVSTAERRALIDGSKQTQVRLLDFMGIIPAITGKVELVYEGEQEGAGIVAENLIGAAVKSILPEYFPALEDLKSSDQNNPYKALIDWFAQGKTLDMLFEWSDAEYQKALEGIGPLNNLMDAYQSNVAKEDRYFLMELVLWALSEYSRLNKERLEDGFNFADLFSSYLRSGEL
ncbi:MoxR family ATPase [Croceimicrobium hydrocarbonivorans]|uniref:Sigma 54-interacting transcriptional regulator n=1 Tax=Croceimicrobium hydrocarbonivorans TaxID=2761580 RepID=A0A7H0VDB0_9FLAO|nr:sigma 54-interacting transcriptional regulator [Croceimicrobium hydrocarbonivorans]QNR23708.1 sigma 54-interacting transcriptional regulator [Croceimicrobium hydrocarbonivorans]